MRVVSDSDVIIHLSKLGKLSLLQTLYTEVAIPGYVKYEILRKENKGIKDSIGSFIKVFPLSEKKAVDIARCHGIHIGEAHVKALGEELKSTLILSNEKKVRGAAKEEGFKVAGTVGLILRACWKGLISETEGVTLLEKMKDQDYRIHPDIIQKSLIALKNRG